MDRCLRRRETLESNRVMDVPQHRRYFSIDPIKHRIFQALCSLGFLQAGGEAMPPMGMDVPQHRGPIKTIMQALGFSKAGGEDMPLIDSVPDFLKKINIADLFAFDGEYVPMSPEIFSAVTAGKKEWREKKGSTQIACLESYRKDSVLHLAAAWGHLELVKSIVSECPCLLLKPNSKNQLPLHVAARAGHLAVVKALVAALKFVSASDGLSEEDKKRVNVYGMKDKDGDTALHLALNSDLKIATVLLNADKKTSFLANKDGRSPLHMAVEIGTADIVKEMLETTDTNGLYLKLEGRKDLVHVALKAKRTEILDVILGYSSLGEERDEKGMTCLSFGASIGFHEGVCKLLNWKKESVYVCNDDGSFPIHHAVQKRHSKVFDEILNGFPDSVYLLNRKEQNILHITAESGKAANFSFRYLWKNHLMEKQDVDGNTPLHLATINWRPRTVFYLSWFGRRKNQNTRNNAGLTALDIAESTMQPNNYIFRERMTLMVLLNFYAWSLVLQPRMLFKLIKRPSSCPQAVDKRTPYINVLLVVASLVAAVTFAAGFTVPGGFNSSGRATLAGNSKLVQFMIFDILALQSSIVTISTLIWAQLGDPAFARISLNMALPSLFFSLIFMAAAFYCGVLVAFADVKGVVIFTNVTSVIFFFIMLVLLGPHVSLHIPGNSLLLGPYFMLLFLLVDESSNKVVKSSDNGEDRE